MIASASDKAYLASDPRYSHEQMKRRLKRERREALAVLDKRITPILEALAYSHSHSDAEKLATAVLVAGYAIADAIREARTEQTP